MEQCFKISGRVQRVGYRAWAIRQAASLKTISGYITNLPEGDVLVLLAGEKEDIDNMLVHLAQGPLFARVDNITSAPELRSYFPPLENGVFKKL